MKRLLPAITAVLVVLLGIAAFLLWGAVRDVVELKYEVARLEAEKQKLAKQAVPKSSSAAADSPKGINPAPQPEESAEKPEDKDAARDMLMGASAKEIASRSKARLELLRTRLKLRPEQMAELEKAAAAQITALQQAFERIRQNKALPPDLGVIMEWTMGHFDVPVKPLLDADQAADYTGFEAEERTSRIEGYVSIEMLELQGQGALHLTTDQKDQVFAALSGIVAEEDALGDAYYADDGRFMARVDESLHRRREVLKELLDATQLDNYDRVLAEDRTQIQELFSGKEPAN